MIRKSGIFCFFLVLLLTACDPVKELIITPSEKSNNSITLYFNTVGYSYWHPTKPFVRVSNKDTCCNKEFSIFFGIGVWGDEDVKSFTRTIDSISIVSETKATTLKAKEEIAAYLMKHRTGFANSLIKIEL